MHSTIAAATIPRIALTLYLAAVGCPACVESAIAPENQTSAPWLERTVAEGATGVALYIDQPGAHVVVARGLANVETSDPLTPQHQFRIASMSKPYLSALLVMLELEGRLSLDDLITDYLPTEITDLISYANQITIYDMLTHWSGIIDYRDLTFSTHVLFGDPHTVRDEYADLTQGLARNPQGCAPPELSPDQLTEASAECLYSNSNYVLAGYIADRVLYGVAPAPGIRAEHHSRAFRERFFAPLGLRETVYEKHLAPGEHFTDRLAHGYFTLPQPDGSVAPGTPKSDVTELDDGYGYANGGLISTPEEVAKFRRATLDPTIPFPMADLGAKRRFLQRYTQSNALGVAPAGLYRDGLWQMTGDIGGYTSRADYDSTRDAVLVLYSNDRDFAGRDDLVSALRSELSR